MAKSLTDLMEQKMQFMLRGITGTSSDSRDRSISISVLALAVAHKIMREVPEGKGKCSDETARDDG